MAWQPAARVDYQPMQSLRGTFKYSGWGQQNPVINGTIPGFNDSQQYKPVVGTWAVTANYSFNADDVPRGHVRPRAERADRLRPGTGRHRSDLLSERLCDERHRQPRTTRVWLDCRICFRTRTSSIPSYYAYEALNGVNPVTWDGSRHPDGAELHLGQPHQQQQSQLRAAEHAVSGLPEQERHRRHVDQPDQGLRPSHAQDRFLQHPQLQGAAAAGLGRHADLQQRQQQPDRFDVRLRQCRARHLQPVQPAVEVRRRIVHLQQYRGLHAGQLEDEPAG